MQPQKKRDKPFIRLWLLFALSAIMISGCCPLILTEEAAPQVLEVATRFVTQTANATFAPALSPTPEGESPSMIPPTIPERRLLILEWPKRIRVGDSSLVRLSLEMDEQGTLTPTAWIEGEDLELAPLEIPNLYETHRIFAQARLDLAGMQIAPEGVLSEQLVPGMPLAFMWSIRATDVGDYLGTVWLHLVFIPREGGEESRLVLSAQTIEIRAVNLLGLGGRSARLLGGVGSLVGSLISLDSLFNWLVKVVQKRRAQRGR